MCTGSHNVYCWQTFAKKSRNSAPSRTKRLATYAQNKLIICRNCYFDKVFGPWNVYCLRMFTKKSVTNQSMERRKKSRIIVKNKLIKWRLCYHRTNYWVPEYIVSKALNKICRRSTFSLSSFEMTLGLSGHLRSQTIISPLPLARSSPSLPSIVSSLLARHRSFA